MKNGNTDFLKSLPEAFLMESPSHEASNRIVRWLKVVNFPEKRLSIGLSTTGHWVREGVDDVCELIPSKGFVPLYPCLEIDREVFWCNLILALDAIPLPVELADTFPIEDILEQALISGSEHWTRAALAWVRPEEATSRVKSALTLVALSKGGEISQKTRQGARFLLKRLAPK